MRGQNPPRPLKKLNEVMLLKVTNSTLRLDSDEYLIDPNHPKVDDIEVLIDGKKQKSVVGVIVSTKLKARGVKE